jgi:hypothetical protein
MGAFELTPLAEPLRSGVPGSVRDLAAMFGTPWHWEAWGDLEQAVHPGQEGSRSRTATKPSSRPSSPAAHRKPNAYSSIPLLSGSVRLVGSDP